MVHCSVATGLIYFDHERTRSTGDGESVKAGGCQGQKLKSRLLTPLHALFSPPQPANQQQKQHQHEVHDRMAVPPWEASRRAGVFSEMTPEQDAADRGDRTKLIGRWHDLGRGRGVAICESDRAEAGRKFPALLVWRLLHPCGLGHNSSRDDDATAVCVRHGRLASIPAGSLLSTAARNPGQGGSKNARCGASK